MARAFTGSRVEKGLIGRADACCVCHRVVTVENQPLRTELAELTFLATPERIKGVHDMLRPLTIQPVQMEISRIQLRPDKHAPLLIPPEWRPAIAQIPREHLHIPGRVGELEYPLLNPVRRRTASEPRHRHV